ncbi:MAG: heavy-metal-associated domain-containing protein [Gemmatimonadota bacterium]
MKQTMISAALAVFLLAVASPALGQARDAPTPPGDSLRLEVDGMVCSLCAYGVERRLKKIEDVEGITVELDSGLVVLTLRPGAAVSDSVLTAEVRRAGFALRNVERYTRKPGEGGSR